MASMVMVMACPLDPWVAFIGIHSTRLAAIWRAKGMPAVTGEIRTTDHWGGAMAPSWLNHRGQGIRRSPHVRPRHSIPRPAAGSDLPPGWGRGRVRAQGPAGGRLLHYRRAGALPADPVRWQAIRRVNPRPV